MEAKLLDFYGSDDFICDVARVSHAKEAKNFTKEQNTKLLHFLAEHNHVSPFHHPVITLRMKAPVPIRTQCFKSKIGFAENEESRRYISSRPELFVPGYFRSKPEGSIKQGSGGIHPRSDRWLDVYTTYCTEMIDTYMDALEDGIAPEQARFFLPQGVEVNWIWTGSLAAYARYYNLRSVKDAQGESRDLADEVSKLIEPLFPVSWKALVK